MNGIRVTHSPCCVKCSVGENGTRSELFSGGLTFSCERGGRWKPGIGLAVLETAGAHGPLCQHRDTYKQSGLQSYDA